LVALPCLAAAPGDFQWRQPIVREDPTREEVLAVRLGNDLYAATRDDLADIRVFDGDGAEVPYVLERAVRRRTRVESEVAPTEVLSLDDLADNVIEVVVRQTAPGPVPPTRLSVQTPLHDFDKRVTVWGSRDREGWTALCEDQPVFDYRRFMDVRRTDVDFGPGDYTFYKVSIRNVAEVAASPFVELSRETRDNRTVSEFSRTILQRRDFRIDRMTFWRSVRRDNAPEEQTVEYPVEGLTVMVNPAGQRSELLIRAARQPLCAVRILTGSRNFHRRVTVEAPSPEPGADWTPLGGGVISDLSFGAWTQSETEVPFGERRVGELRVFIHNGDSPPLSITGVQLIGKAHRLRFLAARNGVYRVCFGNGAAKLPRYDAGAVLARIPGAEPPRESALGEAVENPDWSRPRLRLGRLLERRGLLAGALVVMVGVLAVGIWQAAGRINRLPEEPPPKS